MGLMRWLLSGWFGALLAFGILVVLALSSLGPRGHDPLDMAINGYIQQVRQISLILFSYSADHQGAYPSGHSSTEVFQQLLDGQYCDNASLFYVPMPGKRAPVPGKKLKPKNVSFDLTAGADLHSPPGLPLVFQTGYRVTYAPDGAASSRQSIPDHTSAAHSVMMEWPGIAVSSIDNQRLWRTGSYLPNGTVVIPHFLPPDFNPASGHYQQLTPDGPL